MFTREFECPSCGAPIRRESPNTRTLVCSHCGQTSFLNAESLEMVGNKQLLMDYGSVFQLGQMVGMGNREFLVLGRMRFDYEDGFWDEWFIRFMDNGEEAWIQEDDGSFILYQQEQVLSPGLLFDRVKVGSTDKLQGVWEPIFVTSKEKARVNGGEGELPFRIRPGEAADFADGIWQGKPVSIEWLPGETVLFTGRPLSLNEVVFK